MVKFDTATYDTFRDIIYFPVNYFLVQTDGQTESDAYEPTVQVAYEPTVQVAQVGPNILILSGTFAGKS